MTNDELAADLQDSCTAVAHENFDATVDVFALEGGRLRFALINDDDEETVSYIATRVGAFEGHELYRFTGPDVDVVMTLVPIAIVGLMAL